MDGATIEDIKTARDNARMCIALIGVVQSPFFPINLVSNISALHRKSISDHWRAILIEQRQWALMLIDSHTRCLETIELARAERGMFNCGGCSTALGAILDVNTDCLAYVFRPSFMPSWAQINEPIREESSLEEWRARTFNYLAYLSAYKPPTDLVLLGKGVRDEAALTIRYLMTLERDQHRTPANPVDGRDTVSKKHWPDLTILVSEGHDMLLIREKGKKEIKKDAQALGLSPAMLDTLRELVKFSGDMTMKQDVGCVMSQRKPIAGMTVKYLGKDAGQRQMAEKDRTRLSRLNEALRKAFSDYQERAIQNGKTRFKIERMQSEQEHEIQRILKESKWDDKDSTRSETEWRPSEREDEIQRLMEDSELDDQEFNR